MAKRECANLIFTLTDKETGKSLVIGEGGGQYSEIQKSEEMFSALKGFTSGSDEGRTIPIPIYLNSMNDTAYLNNFLNPKKKYDLKIFMNNVNYYTQCKTSEPELSNCDDLYGDKSKLIVYTINLILLSNKNYFTTDYVGSKSVGAGLKNNYRLGKYYPIPLNLTYKKEEFPKFKSPIPSKIDLVLTDRMHATEYNATIMKQEDGSYIFNCQLDNIEVEDNIILIIKSIDSYFDMYRICPELSQFFEFSRNLGIDIIYDLTPNEINISGLDKEDYMFLLGALQGYVLLLIMSKSGIPQANYNITLNIKNKVLRSPDTNIFGFNYNGSSLYHLTLINNNDNVKLTGTFEALGATFDGMYIYNPIIENYFNLTDDLSNLKATSGITSSSGKAVKFGIIKIVGDKDTVYMFILAHQDDTDVEAGEIFTFNLTPDKNDKLEIIAIDNSDWRFICSLVSPLVPVNVNNTGGEGNGFLLKINPKSTLVNPMITNVTTGFSMKMLITVRVGDTLEIDTENKSVKVNNTYYQNIKRIMDDWLVMEQGLNTIKFSADSGESDAEVLLYFRNKLRGL